MRRWQASDAKQSFGRLVDAARAEPQLIVRHAEPVGVVMSFDGFCALKQQADKEFAAFLLASPVTEEDLGSPVGMSLSDDG